MRLLQLFFIGFIVINLNFSCSKEPVKLLLFSESIIGKWEWREAVDRVRFQDLEWHNLTPPYQSLNFEEDGSYTLIRDCSIILDEGTFTVSDTDSTITITTVFTQILKPEAFTNDSFTLTFIGNDEGVLRHKYYKVN